MAAELIHERQWPSTPEEMDELAGVKGHRVPDRPETPGRSKVVWRLEKGVGITFEKHPYHVYAQEADRGAHWHLERPGKPRRRFLPGQEMPEC